MQRVRQRLAQRMHACVHVANCHLHGGAQRATCCCALHRKANCCSNELSRWPCKAACGAITHLHAFMCHSLHVPRALTRATPSCTCLRACAQAEAAIQELQAGMEERLNSMPPSQRAQYYELVAEQQTLQQESKRFEEAVDELDK